MVTAIALLLIVVSAAAVAYAVTNPQQFQYEITDTIDIADDGIYDLGTLVTNETYTVNLTDPWVIKVYGYAGNLTIAFVVDNPNVTHFETFQVSIYNLTAYGLVDSFDMTTRTVKIESAANQEYGYILDFKVRQTAPDGVQGTVELDVIFDKE